MHADNINTPWSDNGGNNIKLREIIRKLHHLVKTGSIMSNQSRELVSSSIALHL